MKNRLNFWEAKITLKYLTSLIVTISSYFPVGLNHYNIAHAEAMARGLIVIGCKGEGNEAFITNEKTGFLIKKHSSNAITDILLKILDNEYNLKEIEGNAVKVIKNNFTWEQSAEKLISLYNKAVYEE